MKRTIFVAVLALLAVTAIVAGVSAQSDGVSGGFIPFTINVKHAEPVTVTAAVALDDGEIVTVTTPITIAVGLRIDVEGPDLVAVTSDGPVESAITLTIAEPKEAEGGEGAYEDAAGGVYLVEALDGIVVGQVPSSESFTGVEFFGLVENRTDAVLKYIEVTIQSFDGDGTLLGVSSGYLKATELAPGASTTFQSFGDVEHAEIAGYVVQGHHMGST